MVDPATPAILMRVGKSERNGMTDIVALIGRIFISSAFIISGISKTSAPAATMDFISSVGLPFPQLGLAIAIVIETAVTVAFLVGYHTRMMAALIVVYCFATAVFFHNAWSDVNQLMHFWKNMTMAGGLMQVIAFGAGRYSLDAFRS